MEDKLTTSIVNEAEHDLNMKFGNRNGFVPFTLMEEGTQYAIELRMNWTYQELSLERKRGDGEEKKVFVTSDDCCNYERVPATESNGSNFVTDRVRQQQFNAYEQTATNPIILPLFLAAYGGLFKGAVICDNILRGDSKLASAALMLARHVRLKGLRGGSADSLLELVLQLVEFAQRACESPLLGPARMSTLCDHQLQDPLKYAASLMLLARDVDAHPWGAFGFVHPTKYLPFLQQLAGDLIDH